MRNKIIIVFLVCILFITCSKQVEEKSMKIGVVLGLTGKYSHLGLSLKDGIILAFDEIDYTINGKKIDLIFKDDQQNDEINTKAINQLIADDIKIILGNATSSMSKISYNILLEHPDTLLFSPSASSTYFSGKKDNFLRIQPANSVDNLCNLPKLLKKYKAKHIYFIGDTKNKEYLKDFIKIVDVSDDIKYEAIIDGHLPYDVILEKVKDADFIVAIHNSLDAANLTQYLRTHNNNTPIIFSGWAKTDQFLEHAGKWANGIYFISSDRVNEKDSSYEKFAKKFYSFYKKEVNKQNIKGYKLAQIIIEALKKGHYSTDEIKKYILTKKKFHFLGDELFFDEYGDMKRTFYIFQVIDNKIKKVNYKW